MSKQGSLIKSTFIIMIMTVLSKTLGFIRDMLIASDFGAGMYTDAYTVAVSVPETVFTLIGLAISTAFLPMLSKIKAKSGDKKMYDFANNVINILFIISVIFFIISSIFSKQIVELFAGGLNEESLNLASTLTKITLINILFLSVNACYTAMLQVNENFVLPSVLGLFFNLPMIIYLIIFKQSDILGLTIANVIGNFLRMAVQLPPLIKDGYRIKIFINLKDKMLYETLMLIIPVIIAAGCNQVNMIVDKKIASSLETGSISALDYGQKLILFINSIITTSIINVAYPVMANMINNNDEEGFIKTLKESIVYIGILLIPLTFGVCIFSSQIVTAVYGRGQFNAHAVSLTSAALAGYSFGIFFTAIRDIFNSTLFSMGKTKVTTINGVIGVGVNIIFNIILSKYFGIMGIALSSGIAMAVTALLLFRSILNINKNFEIKDLIKKILIIFINSIIMTAVIMVIQYFIEDKTNIIIQLAAGTSAGLAVYFLMCYVFKLEEVIKLKNMVMRKVKSNE